MVNKVCRETELNRQVRSHLSNLECEVTVSIWDLGSDVDRRLYYLVALNVKLFPDSDNL